MSNTYSLMIHGGAGALEDLKHEASEDEFTQSITAILEQGRQRLEQGDSALDVVEYCVTLLEDDWLYNAGRGSVLNAEGKVEMDAALMDGRDLRAGAVACIKQIKNPIALARRVLEQGDHVLLVGDGALAFAQFCQMDLYPDDYFVTTARIQQLAEAQAAGRMTLDHERIKPSQKLGTVGAVARDL
ncbi:MAG: isoaspartyl peptidase/L-asparaginase, partial [Thermosynechococcaceae cyanobacterium]